MSNETTADTVIMHYEPSSDGYPSVNVRGSDLVVAPFDYNDIFESDEDYNNRLDRERKEAGKIDAVEGDSEVFEEDVTPLHDVANQTLVNFFKSESAGNFIAHEIEDIDTGEQYLITMQKSNGETPLHQLAKANDRIAVLEHAIMQATTLALRRSELFGGCRLDVAERLKETSR